MEGQTKALVVDDDSRALELIRAVLESAGLAVQCLSNSADAAGRVQMEKFDVLFLDLHMPVPDGLTLARLVRSGGLNRRTPVVLITADHSPLVLRQGFDAGATFFLFKPVGPQRVLQVVRASEAAMLQDKRMFQRVAIECRAVLSHGRLGKSVEGHTVDMSLNGLLVRADSTFAPGEKVEVKVLLTSGQPPIQALGRIARLLEDGSMGIELVCVTPPTRERLQEFLLPFLLEISPAGTGQIEGRTARRNRPETAP